MADDSIGRLAAEAQYYVYIYRDPRPGKGAQPIYVGKGDAARSRAYTHVRQGSHNQVLNRVLAKIRAAGYEPIIEIVERFDSEDAAFAREIELIAAFGRRCVRTGPLCNFSIGGEGPSGLKHSPESIAQMKRVHSRPEATARSARTMHRLRDDPDFEAARLAADPRRKEAIAAFQRGPENRAAKSAQMKAALAANPTMMEARRAQLSAVTSSPEARARYSEATKAAWADPLHREKRSAAIKAALNEPAALEKRRQQTIARWADPEARARQSEACRAAKLRYLARKREEETRGAGTPRSAA